MTHENTFSGWCCQDCLFLIADGESPLEMDQIEVDKWLAEIDFHTQGQSSPATLGHFHTDEAGCWHPDEECPDEDCDCERRNFVTTPCDHCGSSLAGSRDAVTFWYPATV